MNQHRTVLLDEAVDALVQKPDGLYIDGTFGRGGHSGKILQCLSDNGRLFGVDKDPEAVDVGNELALSDPRFSMHHQSFADLQALPLSGSIDGIILDLGVSSPQLDVADRGFSFMKNGPLDMRMNPHQGISAAQWINVAEEIEISRVLWDYGEERCARKIAQAIVAERQINAIDTTGHLADLIKKIYPYKGYKAQKKHPATRSFQAIRIYLNKELEELTLCLDLALALLSKNGRLVVISFHSLEDRIVKRFIRKHVKGDFFPDSIPVTESQLNRQLETCGKAQKASITEIKANPRARSAIMRIAKKLI